MFLYPQDSYVGALVASVTIFENRASEEMIKVKSVIWVGTSCFRAGAM